MEVLAVTYKTGEFPVYADGSQKGTVTVTWDGLMLAIECACDHDGPPAPTPGHVPRLVALCDGKYVPLGIPVPQGGALRLARRFSKSSLQARGYTNPESFLLMTQYELEAALNPAPPPAESAPAPEKAGPSANEPAPEKPGSAPTEPDAAEPPPKEPAEAESKPPKPELQPPRDVQPRPAPPPAGEKGAMPIRRYPPPHRPMENERPPAIRRPPFMGSSGEKDTLKPELNQDSKLSPPASPAPAALESRLKPDAAPPKPPEAAKPHHPAPPVETPAQTPHEEGGKSAAAAPEAAARTAPQKDPDNLNEHSNPLEALAPALGNLIAALGAPNPLSPAEEEKPPAQPTANEAPHAPPPIVSKGGEGEKMEEPAAPPAKTAESEKPESWDLSAGAKPAMAPTTAAWENPAGFRLPAPKSAAEIAQIRFDEMDPRELRRPFLDAARPPKEPERLRSGPVLAKGAEDADAAGEADAPAPPLVGGWRPAPPLSRLIGDPALYEGHENVPGALVTEQDGLTLLAVPVSPEEPFPLMSVFCFGYPTQIGEKDYLLFKIQDGALAP